MPNWDQASQKKVRDALLVLAATLPDFKKRVRHQGARSIRCAHLIGTAAAWGGNPDKDATYLNVTPAKNDGKTVYRLTVKDVPVDGFWSVSLYNAEGYYEKNPYDAYSLNNITAKKSADGSIAIQFGGCDGKIPNCLPIMEGWNYTVRLYRPRAEILNGKWKFPEPQPVELRALAMSGLDIFAWIVLIILVASAVAVFCIAGWLPGHIAKTPRPSVGAGRHGRRLGHADLRLRAVAGRADLGLCRRAGRARRSRAMIDRDAQRLSGAAVRCWCSFGVVRFNLFWKASPFIVLLLLLIGAVHPDGMGRAAGRRAGGAQCGRDRARRRRRGDRGAGRGQHAAQGRRRPVPHRSRALSRRRSRRSRRS